MQLGVASNFLFVGLKRSSFVKWGKYVEARRSKKKKELIGEKHYNASCAMKGFARFLERAQLLMKIREDEERASRHHLKAIMERKFDSWKTNHEHNR